MSFAQVQKATGKVPQALKDLEPIEQARPDELMYLFEWWTEVVGEARLSWVELEAWANMTGKRPTGWEAEVMQSIDREFHKQWMSQVLPSM